MMLLTKETLCDATISKQTITQSSTKENVGLQQELVVTEPFEVEAKQKKKHTTTKNGADR